MPKLPPFGKKVQSVLNNTPKNDIYLFCGHYAWDKARNHGISRSLTLCLPPWTDATDYEWPVKDYPVIIFDTSGSDDSYIRRIAYSLFLAGASRVISICPYFKITVYKGI